METGIKVGGGPEPESVAEISIAIMKILEARVDQKTMRAALNVLVKSCSTSYVTVSGCSVINDERKEAKEADPSAVNIEL